MLRTMAGGSQITARSAGFIAGLALCAVQASAQYSSYSPSYQGMSAWDRLEPVDPGLTDLGGLAQQTRLLSTVMHADHSCNLLYRAMSPSGPPLFARRDGGITAVFPRSEYAQTPWGEVALIPADTKFIIGEPSGHEASRLGLGAPPTQADPSHGLRLDTRLDARNDPQAEARRSFLLRDGEKPAHRVGVRALLERAAARERAGY